MCFYRIVNNDQAIMLVHFFLATLLVFFAAFGFLAALGFLATFFLGVFLADFLAGDGAGAGALAGDAAGLALGALLGALGLAALLGLDLDADLRDYDKIKNLLLI